MDVRFPVIPLNVLLFLLPLEEAKIIKSKRPTNNMARGPILELKQEVSLLNDALSAL